MDNTISYALGMSIAQNLLSNGINEINTPSFVEGFEAIIKNQKPTLSMEKAQTVLSEYFQSLQNQQSSNNAEEGKKFLEANKKKSGVITLENGLQYEILKEGNGAKPQRTDTVVVHYEGTLVDGRVFDSSVRRGEPASFPVTAVIPGWTEILQLMPVGSKWRVAIPSDLAYGERGAGQLIGPNATLIFEIELLSIEDAK